MTPVIRLKIVVFPAPLEPIRPVIWPCSIFIENWLMAANPPKRLLISFNSSSMVYGLLFGRESFAITDIFSPISNLGGQSCQALRHQKQDDQQDSRWDKRHIFCQAAGEGLEH